MKIKIIGCGSAGNHISFAFSKYAKKITMTDTSEKFFLRSKKIYIQRYNKWNNKIDFKLEKNDKTFYDVILISSPPNTHFKLLKKNIDKANLFMIEKPLLQPSKLILDKFNNLIKSKKNKKILCGYNHRLFPSTKKFLELFRNKIKLVNSLTINFKETTSGFLKAHNWMKSIEESYLGSTKNGGGSLCEHSHGINLAQFFIPTLNDKDLINKKIKFSQNKKYDLSSELLFKKKIYGAGLDVFYNEPTMANDKLNNHENVLATPHIAGTTIDTHKRVIEKCLLNIDKTLKGSKPSWIV